VAIADWVASDLQAGFGVELLDVVLIASLGNDYEDPFAIEA